jgi:hypothetical protein
VALVTGKSASIRGGGVRFNGLDSQENLKTLHRSQILPAKGFVGIARLRRRGTLLATFAVDKMRHCATNSRSRFIFLEEKESYA